MYSYFENLHAKCHGGGAFFLGLRLSSECMETTLIYIPPMACEPLFPASKVIVLHFVFCLFFYVALAGLELAM